MAAEQRYSFVIFDVDGVILNTAPICARVIKEVSLEFDLSLNRTQIWQQSADLASAVEHGLPRAQLADYISLIRAGIGPLIEKAPLHDGIIDALIEIKKDMLSLGVVSSNHRARHNLEIRKLDNFFDVILYGDQIKKHKPDPEGILTAMLRMGARASDTVYVGDAETDISTARNARIASVLYYPDCHREVHDFDRLMASKPTHLVRTHEELKKLLVKSRN